MHWMKNKYVLVSGVIAALFVLFVSFSDKTSPQPRYHGSDFFKTLAQSDSLPQGENGLFTGSGRCEGCHGHDPKEFAGYTQGGEDVNVTDQWRASMMANSAKDPFWMAKVSHEVAVNPAHKEILEDKCTSCHAPLGKFGAQFHGDSLYAMADLLSDALGRDGVSCNACHQQNPRGLGSHFSGNLHFVSDTLFGPYGGRPEEEPIFSSPMNSFVGFQPTFGPHVTQSELCADCHSLITQTVDLEGKLTGGSFVEQATYHEWLNSDFNKKDNSGTECQGCHFPRIEEPIVISANYIFLTGRAPYGLHNMVGANSFMLSLLRDFKDTLGLAAGTEAFDKSIALTESFLQNEAADLTLVELGVKGDTALYVVSLTNLTGHKFPSGYPSRRTFVQFIATNDGGDTLLQSGMLLPDQNLRGEDLPYEPHHDQIRSNDDLQIYELVMGDVNAQMTTILERADHPLKDNRLTPKGFSVNHISYDTTLIAGLALQDENFNHDAMGREGSGSDEITYHVGLNGYTGRVQVSARLFYQPVPPKWNREMFETNTPEISHFKSMFEASSYSPVLVAEAQLESMVVSVPESSKMGCRIFPNPLFPGMSLQIKADQPIQRIEIYDGAGRIQFSQGQIGSTSYECRPGLVQGAYVVKISVQGQIVLQRILVL